MFSFDLKSGYHHIDIFPEHRKFLAFSWKFSDGSVRYMYSAFFMLNMIKCTLQFDKVIKKKNEIYKQLRLKLNK